jgi:4-nitrophenyl phosphatase
MVKSQVAAVLLAAGGSTRFGHPKQLLPWHGRPLITHTLDTAWIAGLDPRVVVLGAEAERIRPALADRDATVMVNYRWEKGMSTSVALGLAALPPSVEAAIFLPIDQPLIDAALLRGLVDAWEEGVGTIVIPRSTNGRRGSPVLFDRAYFAELSRLSGDVGGRAIFERHPEALTHVMVPDSVVLTDADTPEAFEALQKHRGTINRSPDFSALRGIISDMDGVLWRGDDPQPGLRDFFALLHDHALPYVLVTNNSSHTPQEYVDKLAGMGITTTIDHVLGSAEAAAIYVAAQSPGAEVYAIGGPGVLHALRTHGLSVTQAHDTRAADYVVVGWDRALTWQKLATATRLIHNGAVFVGSNPDLTFPMEAGLAPGNGAQLAALEAATGVEPIVVGKPETLLYQQAMARMGTSPAETLMVGDRLDTDILGAAQVGMPTVLVLTGISGRDALDRSPIRPTGVYEDLPTLVTAWRTALETVG